MFARRKLFSLAPGLGAVALLAACATTKTGTNTTVTLDMQRIQTDGAAVIQLMQSALAVPVIQNSLGVHLADAQTYLEQAQASFAAATSQPVSASLDTSSVQAAVQSMVDNANKLFALVEQVSPTVPDANVQSTLQTWISAAQSLLPLIQMAASLIVMFAAKPGSMTEDRALMVAHEAPHTARMTRKAH